MFGVGWEDDDGRNIGENCSQVAQESAEERHQLAGRHGKCARHRRTVLAVVTVTRLQTVGHGCHDGDVDVLDRQPEWLQLL